VKAHLFGVLGHRTRVGIFEPQQRSILRERKIT
jgi:hypothetical protein